MHKFKIGIVGLGVTGGSLLNFFETHRKDLEIAKVDPAKEFNDSLEGCWFVFICVPTPFENGQQNISILLEVLGELPNTCLPIIRSTVTPGTTARLQSFFTHTIWHLPEFLTERSAHEDMFGHKQLYLGADQISMSDLDLLRNLFPDKVLSVVSTSEAEMIKYGHNCFGALKVTYFNALHELCKYIPANFEKVRNGMLTVTDFINKEHTRVPGPDGKFGYGGKCFPDNVKSLEWSSLTGTGMKELMRITDLLNELYRQRDSSESI